MPNHRFSVCSPIDFDTLSPIDFDTLSLVYFGASSLPLSVNTMGLEHATRSNRGTSRDHGRSQRTCWPRMERNLGHLNKKQLSMECVHM